MGLAESYASGAWTAKPSPKEFISLLIRAKRRQKGLRCENRLFLLKIFKRFTTFPTPNTPSRSLQNAKAHYDLGNGLFQLFLDPSLTYSCALFEDIDIAKTTFGSPSLSSIPRLIYGSQMRKYDALLEWMGELGSQSRILEVGCGWGAFGLRAVQRFNCSWTGLTLSNEQLKYAEQQIMEAQLGERIQLKLLDYRFETGVYDHVVAVEMIEAVGHECLPTFFESCANRLKPGGKLCIQAILCRDEHYEEYRRSTDFIRKHIFPGGHLISLSAIKSSLPDQLKIVAVRQMDEHYALTLDIWRDSWLRNRRKILSLCKCETFYRKWDMYFSLCAALFENGSIHCAQVLLEKSRPSETC